MFNLWNYFGFTEINKNAVKTIPECEHDLPCQPQYTLRFHGVLSVPTQLNNNHITNTSIRKYIQFLLYVTLIGQHERKKELQKHNKAY